jgi:hypothetical protein
MTAICVARRRVSQLPAAQGRDSPPRAGLGRTGPAQVDIGMWRNRLWDRRLRRATAGPGRARQ